VRVAWPASVDELAARGPALLAETAASALGMQRALLDKWLHGAQKRLERRLTALTGDIDRAQQAIGLRARANSIMTNLHAIPRGASSAQLLDYSLDPPALQEITLDPTRTAREQIDAWFKQARRFERGAELALPRRAATHRELEQLTALRGQLKAADRDGLDQIAQEARALGVRGLGQTAESQPERGPQRHKPYRELRGHKQRTILVGKGADDNDTLTREHARPQDLWLHARDVAGAHVVVPLERAETCPAELLLDAAHLAAHFSEARNEPIVDISYTPKRYVRKPRGAPKGTVQLDKEKVIHLEVDPARLKQLLATETR
jgi:predicted ribosome quality control (RQC) complex YloA/Tae2 family protein